MEVLKQMYRLSFMWWV